MIAELAFAVPAHELLTTFDCRTWSCSGEASAPGGLCSYCAGVDELRRQGEALAWRRLVRTLDPPADAGCSPLTFQAVAAALADHVGTPGSPSVAELSHASRASERTVQAALAALEARGLIARDTRGGRGQRTRYALRGGRPGRAQHPDPCGEPTAVRSLPEQTPKVASGDRRAVDADRLR